MTNGPPLDELSDAELLRRSRRSSAVPRRLPTATPPHSNAFLSRRTGDQTAAVRAAPRPSLRPGCRATGSSIAARARAVALRDRPQRPRSARSATPRSGGIPGAVSASTPPRMSARRGTSGSSASTRTSPRRSPACPARNEPSSRCACSTAGPMRRSSRPRDHTRCRAGSAPIAELAIAARVARRRAGSRSFHSHQSRGDHR